ncbi:dCMP deaminase family protein [bacterium]|nr:dCMP deaminase family protein [bacterium]MBU1637354.1 dCMP deaminase family protein [bacterium]MBU1919620.1 dCMP deaminase family protein [bacterium]
MTTKTKADRISWDEYFYGIVHLVAERSVCLRRKVGCLIVRNHQILASGYNGPPAGHPHPDELGGCERDIEGIKSGERLELCVCLHAEQNALLQCARNGVAVEGAEIYVTVFPCPICARMIANSGIKHVKVFGTYPGEARSRSVLEKCGIAITMLDVSGFRTILTGPPGWETADEK